MSDLFSLLSTTAQSLDAQRFGLDVVGQNLANANTSGYSKRSITLEAVPPLDQLSAGGGVRVEEVSAARAPLLDSRLYRERPTAGREAAVADQLAVIESVVGAPGTSLDARLSEFFDAFATLASTPTSSVTRQLVLVQGQSLSQAFQDMASRFTGVQRDADAEVRSVVDQINTLAQKVASLNVAIGNAAPGSADTLRDEQALALQSLAELVDIGVIPREGGGVDVTVGNGVALVASEHTYALSTASAGAQGFAQVLSGSTDLTAQVTAGRLGGLMFTRDVLVSGYISRLDNLAYSVANSVNALHTSGVDLTGAAGVNFFTPSASATGAAGAMAVNPLVAADSGLVAAGLGVPGDNQVARAIAGLRQGSPSPIDDWGALLNRVGTDRQSAQSELKTREDVLAQLESLRSQITGVSIDEEAATMLRFQRAYEANARFFSVVNGLLDTLLTRVG